MPFSRPSLSDLRTQVAADINAALPGVDALLRYSNLGIMGDVLAALASGHYGYADWIALQSVPFTATEEFLEGWAALKGVTRKPATPATGQAAFAATNGAVVPAGTVVNRSDGVSYATTADATAAGGAVTVTVQATEPGADGNASPGTALTLFSGISGVTVNGSALGAITGGAAVERDDELRSRMLAAYASPPQGGSITDYPGWALAVPGVTRAWVVPGAMGPGTLSILFMMDGAQAAHGGFPQGTNGVSAYETRDTAATGDQLAVANAVFPLQSVTALVYAVAPIPNELTITLAGLSGVNDATKQGIEAAIAAALLIDAVPGGLTYVSAIESAIAGVAGTSGFVLTGITASAGTVGNGGIGNVISSAGALPVLGAVVWA